MEPSLQRLDDAQFRQSGPGSHKTKQEALNVDQLPNYSIEYDKLVLAVGCYSATFGTPGVREYAHFLKDIRDARRIRTTFLCVCVPRPGWGRGWLCESC